MAVARGTRNVLAGFLKGASYPFRGLKLIFSDRRILLLSVAPFLLTLLIYCVSLVVLIAFADDIAGLVMDPGAWWRNVIRWFLMIALVFATLTLFVFTYAFFSFMIAAPFLELISCAVERETTGEVKEEPFSIRILMADTWRAITSSARILVIEIVVLVFGLLLGPVTTVVAFMLSGILMALESLDPPMGRRRMVFKERVRYAARHFWLLLGFGLTVLVGLLVPFAGIIFLPMGVAGGTVLFCDAEATEAHGQ